MGPFILLTQHHFFLLFQTNVGTETQDSKIILVSKLVSVSTDTNYKVVGISMEMEILVSPSTGYESIESRTLNQVDW